MTCARRIARGGGKKKTNAGGADGARVGGVDRADARAERRRAAEWLLGERRRDRVRVAAEALEAVRVREEGAEVGGRDAAVALEEREGELEPVDVVDAVAEERDAADELDELDLARAPRRRADA